MKRHKTVGIGLLLLALIIMTTTVHAEDFTFNVPVELHKIPSGVWTFKIGATVYDKTHTPVGYGNTPDTTLVNGEYVGTMTIKFNAYASKDPATATSYEVYIMLNQAGGCLNTMNLDGPYPYDQTKPLVCSVKGTLLSAAGKILTTPSNLRMK